jgi:hypothetical protein
LFEEIEGVRSASISYRAKTSSRAPRFSREGSFGGGAFLKKLAGRKIFARGLLQKHPAFGYQLVVSEPSMFWRIS